MCLCLPALGANIRFCRIMRNVSSGATLPTVVKGVRRQGCAVVLVSVWGREGMSVSGSGSGCL